MSAALYNHLDTSRSLRQGVAEVIYGQGKTKEQIKGIVNSLLANGGSVSPGIFEMMEVLGANEVKKRILEFLKA